MRRLVNVCYGPERDSGAPGSYKSELKKIDTRDKVRSSEKRIVPNIMSGGRTCDMTGHVSVPIKLSRYEYGFL